MSGSWILPLLLAAAGCATSAGFNRTALRSEIAAQPVVTEADIQKALDARPQLPSPFRLAIHFVPAPEPQYGSKPWGWLREDKQVLLDAAAEL